MKHLLAILTMLVSVAACGGGSEKTSTPATVTVTATPATTTQTSEAEPEVFTITGSITVSNEGSRGQSSCFPRGGYDDIQAGTDVVVYNGSGRKVAVGSLESGVSQKGIGGFGSDCVFDFTVDNVPEGLGIYAVEVSHRGELTYNRNELDEPLGFTLG